MPVITVIARRARSRWRFTRAASQQVLVEMRRVARRGSIVIPGSGRSRTGIRRWAIGMREAIAGRLCCRLGKSI